MNEPGRIAAAFLLWSLAHGPLKLARFYVALLDLAIPRLRRTAMRNLELAYPDKSAAERRAIVDEVYLSIARLIWVFARFPQINGQNISKWIRYEGLEHYQEAKKTGRGILFATAHFGNWEMQRLRPRADDGADAHHDPAARQSRHRPGRSKIAAGFRATTSS